jgi:hypothetical protein
LHSAELQIKLFLKLGAMHHSAEFLPQRGVKTPMFLRLSQPLKQQYSKKVVLPTPGQGNKIKNWRYIKKKSTVRYA